MGKIVIGADPEVFVEDVKGNLIPAFKFLPGKDKPLKIIGNQSCYWDGFQAEFTVNPSSNLNECIESIRLGMQTVFNKAKEYNPDSKLSNLNVFPVSLDYLSTLEHHLVEFGCMPSFNIYNISGMGADGLVTPHRFAGGHIHFGIGKQTPEVIQRIVKSLDNILGVLSVVLFEKVDNPVRRQYYGLVGEYRLPPHGLEYRTLSNAWLQDPKLAYQILDLAQRIVEYTLDNKFLFNNTEQEVIETILTCNTTLAKKILDKNQHIFRILNYDITQIQSDIKDSVNKNWNL